MNVVGAGFLHDEARDVVSTFHEVGNRDYVADAFLAPTARITFQ
jgi:hypothetical protein